MVFRVDYDAARRFSEIIHWTRLFEIFEFWSPRRHILYILAEPQDFMTSRKCSKPRAAKGFRIFSAQSPIRFGVVFRADYDAARRFLQKIHWAPLFENFHFKFLMAHCHLKKFPLALSKVDLHRLLLHLRTLFFELQMQARTN